MKPEVVQLSEAGQRATTREFFAVVFRRRWIVLGLFLVTLLTVVVVAVVSPVVYVSGGQVLLRRGEQQSIMTPYRQVMNDWETELGSEIQTVRSWPVLQLAQKTLDREGGGRTIVISETQVKAEVSGKSNALAISYEDRDPRVAERACDAVLRAYIEYRQGSQITYPRRFFEEEIARARAELDRWTELRREYSNQSGAMDVPEQRRNLIFLRAQIEQKRADAAAELAQATSEYRLMRQLHERPGIDVPMLVQSPMNENMIGDLKRRVVEQESRIAQLRERFKDVTPEIRNAQVTLDTLRAILGREVVARLDVSRARVEVVQARLAAYELDVAGVDAQLRNMPNQEARLAELDHQLASWKMRYDELVKASDGARVNENTMPQVMVYLLNPASPAQSLNKRDYVRLGLAPAFSLVVGLGLAFFVDGLDVTVHTAGQAEEEVKLPVLAAITERKRRGSRPSPPRSERTPA